MSNSTDKNKSKANLSFLDPVFLTNYGPLSSLNILEYFYLSPFYDSLSCNQELRMQGASIDNLNTMTGKQYIHIKNDSEPTLFIVKEIDRDNTGKARLREVFYCIDGTFYQAPDLYDLVKIRNKKISHYLLQSFENSILNSSSYSAQRGQELFLPPLELNQTNDEDILLENEFPSINNILTDISSIGEMYVNRGKTTEKEQEEMKKKMDITEDENTDVAIAMSVESKMK